MTAISAHSPSSHALDSFLWWSKNLANVEGAERATPKVKSVEFQVRVLFAR